MAPSGKKGKGKGGVNKKNKKTKAQEEPENQATPPAVSIPEPQPAEEEEQQLEQQPPEEPSTAQPQLQGQQTDPLSEPQVDQTLDPKPDQPTDQPSEQPLEQPLEQSTGETSEQPLEQPLEQTSEQTTGQSLDQQLDQPQEEQAEQRPPEQQLEALQDQPSEQQEEQQHEQPEAAVEAEPLQSEVPAELTSEAVPESAADPTQEPAADAVPESALEVTPEAVQEAVPEPVSETVPEALPETTPEAIPESAPEAVLEVTPEAVSESAPEAVPESAPEAATETAPDVTPESPQEAKLEPTQEAEPEQPQPIGEEIPTAPEPEQQPEPLANIDGDKSAQVNGPSPSSSQQTDVSDVYQDPEIPQDLHQEPPSAPEQIVEAAETSPENLEIVNGRTVEPSEPTPVTAPQTPLFSTDPTTTSSVEIPSATEAQFAEVTSPTKTDAPDTEAHAPPVLDPSSENTSAPPAHETTTPVSKPNSPTLKAVSPITKPASPVPRDASPAPKPTSPVPQAAPPMAEPVSPPQEAEPSLEDFHPAAPSVSSSIYQEAYPMPQNPTPQKMASPVSKTVTPLQKVVSPVQKSASPKFTSPLARNAYMSPVLSPHTTPHATPPAPPQMAPMPPPSTSSNAPSTAPSVASYPTAYSPVMSTAGFMPQYAWYPPAAQPHPSAMEPSTATAYRHLRDLTMPSYANGNGFNGNGFNGNGFNGNGFNGNGFNGVHQNGHHRGMMSPPDSHQPEEPIELLQRIQDAIPDINRLLSSYKNTKHKLQAREAEFEQTKTQHEQEIMQKNFYIDALQNQMRKAAHEAAEESTKLKNSINELRMELANTDEKRKDFAERLEESEKSNAELTQTKHDLEDEVKTLNTNMKDAQEAHEQELVRREQDKEECLATQKRELTESFEEIKAEDERAAAEALAAREKELLDQQDSMRADYENQKQQMQEAHDTLQGQFDEKVVELESTQTNLENTHKELESTQTDLENKHKELEDTRVQHANEVEELNNNHANKVADMERRWTDERIELEQRITEKCEELAHCEYEKQKVEEDNVHKEQQVQVAVDNMRLTIGNLGNDCDRLKKTLHSLGEATDLKSTKGDPFFLDCFGQLSRLIVTLSKEHFAYLPIDPPRDVLSKIPQELPSFLDNTTASRDLRSAYVQHIVSKTLTYRMFQPFLFSLGKRYGKADTFFQMLSIDIRRKSVRREAFWRQQTLKAAYTTSDAKESINVVASVIVEEIIDHLKHFADPKHLDSLYTSVRKIVKLAAETWRLARVERELIMASFPAPDSEGTSNEDWEEYGTPKEGCVGSKEDPTRHVILRTFPRIIREAAHEDFAEDEEKANHCTYSHGSVLYSDSPVVMARRQELARRSTDSLSGEEWPRSKSRDSTPSDGKSTSHRRGKGSMDSL